MASLKLTSAKFHCRARTKATKSARVVRVQSLQYYLILCLEQCNFLRQSKTFDRIAERAYL